MDSDQRGDAFALYDRPTSYLTNIRTGLSATSDNG